MGQPALETFAQAATGRWGADQARAGTQEDAVDGCAPALVLEPPDVATLSEMLRWANGARLSVVTRGGGTKLGWGRSTRIDAVISTARLTAPVDHCAGDLTVSVGAGATLAALNGLLGRERQWLPLDPTYSDRATIGGIVASNDSGPRRQRYGTPRDLIIGVEMALADGRTAKAGGRVVKNVAGYDLPRMLCGSFGSLAVITSATFKLVPISPASRTLVAVADRTRQLVDLALALASGPLTPSAIEIASPPPRLLVRIETTEASADRQAAAARETCVTQGASVTIVSDDEETEVWREHEEWIKGSGQRAPAQETFVKVAVLPTQTGDFIDHLDRVASRAGLDWRVGGRAALGVVYVVLGGSVNTRPTSGDATAQGDNESARHAAAIDEIRQNAWARGGSAVVFAAPPEVKALVDPWGDVGDGLPLMGRVKARFDPNGILNPGRGPGGL